MPPEKSGLFESYREAFKVLSLVLLITGASAAVLVALVVAFLVLIGVV